MTAHPRRSRGPSQPSTSPDDPMLTQHQAFVRSLPCWGCGKPTPSECAYVGRLAGRGSLPTDHYLVPLCGPATIWQDCCHSRKHYRGAGRFWSELGIDPLDLARHLWLVSGDATAGLRAVSRARLAALGSRHHRAGREAKGSSPQSALHLAAALRDQLRPIAMMSPAISVELLSVSASRS